MRMARAALNWTVRGLAEATGLHRNTISNIEVGRYAGDPSTLAAIENVLRRAGVEFIDDGGPGVRLRKPHQSRPSQSARAKVIPKDAKSPILTSELIRAARALVRWEQRDLAEASAVSLATIKRLEAMRGVLAAHRSTLMALRRALESAGIEFINGSALGVRLRADSKKNPGRGPSP